MMAGRAGMQSAVANRKQKRREKKNGLRQQA